SPDSSFSAFAGISLLTSLEMLQQYGLLAEKDLKGAPEFDEEKVAFDQVSEFKQNMLQKAYAYCVQQEKQIVVPFAIFCEENVYWLEDYSLYLSMKHAYEMPWFEWPEAIRDRDNETLKILRQELAQDIKREKIIQFLFFRQWEKLVSYCHEKQVYL